jgi:hypothetical protein
MLGDFLVWGKQGRNYPFLLKKVTFVLTQKFPIIRAQHRCFELGEANYQHGHEEKSRRSNTQLPLLIQNAIIYSKSRKIESVVRAENDNNKSQFIAKDEPAGISCAKRAGSSALYLECLPEWHARHQ